MKKINNSKSQWQETRLGDLIQVTHGIYLSSSFFSDGPTASILLTPGNFKIGGGFDGSNIKYYDAARDPVPKKYIIEPKVLEQTVMCLFQYWFTPYRQQPSKPLSAFGKIVCGKTPSKKEHNYFGGPLPFIKIPDLRGQVYITHTGDSLSYEGAATQPSKQIPPNSICVSCIAVIGLTALTSAWCHTNQQINSIIPHHHWNRYYLYCYLKTIGPELEALSAGGTMTLNINTRLFSRLQIPEAPQAMLENFYQAVHPIFNRILLNIRCKERLIKLRDTLLPRLVTGKIKIRAGKVSK